MSGHTVNLLFVCTANVCRSPLAAGLMASNAKQAGARVQIASASVDHEIRQTHPTTVGLLAARGISLGRAQSRPINEALLDGADLVLVMTADHAKAVVGRFPAHRHKVFVVRHLANEAQPAAAADSVASWLDRVHALPRDYVRDEQWDIEDPMGQSDELYRVVDAQLDEATIWLANLLATIPT